eukprot:gene31995-33921_t
MSAETAKVGHGKQHEFHAASAIGIKDAELHKIAARGSPTKHQREGELAAEKSHDADGILRKPKAKKAGGGNPYTIPMPTSKMYIPKLPTPTPPPDESMLPKIKDREMNSRVRVYQEQSKPPQQSPASTGNNGGPVGSGGYRNSAAGNSNGPAGGGLPGIQEEAVLPRIGGPPRLDPLEGGSSAYARGGFGGQSFSADGTVAGAHGDDERLSHGRAASGAQASSSKARGNVGLRGRVPPQAPQSIFGALSEKNSRPGSSNSNSGTANNGGPGGGRTGSTGSNSGTANNGGPGGGRTGSNGSHPDITSDGHSNGSRGGSEASNWSNGGYGTRRPSDAAVPHLPRLGRSGISRVGQRASEIVHGGGANGRAKPTELPLANRAVHPFFLMEMTKIEIEVPDPKGEPGSLRRVKLNSLRTEDLVEYYIKPRTVGTSYSSAVAYGKIELPEDVVSSDGKFTEDKHTVGQAGKSAFGAATFFVSHAWTYRFKDLVSLVAQHYNTVAVEGGLLEVYYWLDFLALDQSKTRESQAMDSADADLRSAHHPPQDVVFVRGLLGTLRVKACVARNAGGDATGSNEPGFVQDAYIPRSLMEEVISHLDLNKAGTRNPDDSTYIKGLIERGFGVNKFNRLLCHILENCMLDALLRHAFRNGDALAAEALVALGAGIQTESLFLAGVKAGADSLGTALGQIGVAGTVASATCSAPAQIGDAGTVALKATLSGQVHFIKHSTVFNWLPAFLSTHGPCTPLLCRSGLGCASLSYIIGATVEVELMTVGVDHDVALRFASSSPAKIPVYQATVTSVFNGIAHAFSITTLPSFLPLLAYTRSSTDDQTEPQKTLQRLHLFNCGIGDPGVMALGSALVTAGVGLKSLDLGYNPKVHAGCRLMDSQGDPGVMALGGALVTAVVGLKSLDLYNPKITPAGLSSLVSKLEKNTTLERLSLARMPVAVGGSVTTFRQALSVNSTIKSLVLSGCKLDDNQLAALTAGLSEAKTLTHLDLEDNCLGVKAGTILAGLLKGNSKLRSLKIDARDRPLFLPIRALKGGGVHDGRLRRPGWESACSRSAEGVLFGCEEPAGEGASRDMILVDADPRDSPSWMRESCLTPWANDY